MTTDIIVLHVHDSIALFSPEMLPHLDGKNTLSYFSVVKQLSILNEGMHDSL